MDFIKAIVFGIVEGLTEFLPVSSTGHLIILNNFLSFSPGFEKTFDIFIQLGAILSVVLYFWDRINPFSKNKTPDERNETFSLWIKVFVAVTPAIILGALFGKLIQEYLFNPYVVSAMLLLFGVIMIFLEKRNQKARYESLKEIGYFSCLMIGLFQCLSFIPGTSRAAATIIGGMVLGLSRTAAVEFSFFLAIPTMFAASSYSILKAGFSFTITEWGVMILGFIVSFIVAYGVIEFFINFIRKHNFIPFGIYRILLGAVVLVYFTMKKFL